MLAWILEACGLEPGFLIGGVPNNFGVSARAGGAGDASSRVLPFVVEADEYDTAFFDKRSKFLHYPSRTTILNNLEFDHADIFPDLAAIETQFHHFVRTLAANGLIVANGEDQALARVLARGCYTPVERFGAGAAWSAAGHGAPDSFSVRWNGAELGRVRWSLSGAHNRANALAAIAAARHCGVEPARAIAALGSFVSVKRRMEVRGTVNGITVYDDFAHHPTAIATTIDGLRATAAGGRIVSVLEPRSNTMKAGVMKDRLAGSLAGSDLVFCYGAELAWDARAVLAPLGAKAAVHDDLDELVTAVASACRAGDRVLVMSNGGFGGIHGKILARLASRSE
jgi:UDP-N-acetylmuramate: L-alanyl-gamma-D-glutamyl-meso-diaminopimelate ligase